MLGAGKHLTTTGWTDALVLCSGNHLRGWAMADAVPAFPPMRKSCRNAGAAQEGARSLEGNVPPDHGRPNRLHGEGALHPTLEACRKAEPLTAQATRPAHHLLFLYGFSRGPPERIANQCSGAKLTHKQKICPRAG